MKWHQGLLGETEARDPAGGRADNPHHRRDELERLRKIYEYYESAPSIRRKWDPSNRGTAQNSEKRWTEIRRALIESGRLRDGAAVLDVGCGTGLDLLRIREEFAPMKLSLHGVDLLPTRIEKARQALPGVRLSARSAEVLPYADRKFDIVFISLVFSSILDEDVARKIASETQRTLSGGGMIICYDTRYPNPWNSQTRPVRLSRLRDLYGGAEIKVCPVILAPPIARLFGGLAGKIYPSLYACTLLRSHYIASIRPCARP